MRRSHLFIKTRKDVSADEVSRNAQLLIRAGYVYKVMAGAYAYTPLGIRVVEKIKQIVREEMDAINTQELIMTSIQHRSTWEQTGRWDDEVVDVWFKSHLKDGTEVGFAWSHEETIIEMLKEHIESYRDLPVNVYQFQTKMRNELRAKSGIMRGREFVMKDAYSCSIDAEQHEAYYQASIDAYRRVFERLGIGDDTYVTFADGGAFTEFSHEFQTVCEAGEDQIYLNIDKGIAVNEEVATDENLKKLGVTKNELDLVKTAEVGNIFNFGIDKSKDMNFTFTDNNGKEQYVHLGSYGIGITRVMGVIAEKFSDDKGLVWTGGIAPYEMYLIRIGNDDAVISQADELYEKLKSQGVEVLYDDRDERPGAMLADADLLGIPTRVVVSEKSLKAGGVEVKQRIADETEIISIDELIRG